MTTLECPDCHGRLDLVTDGEVGVLMVDGYHRRDVPVEYQMVDRPFLACSECEFCIEVNIATGSVVPS
jgi:hypothetical protein